MIWPMKLRLPHIIASCLLAAAISAFAISASAASSLKITNCIKSVSSPKQLTLTCGDGNTVLKGLTWTNFGKPTASAKGTFVINLCEPNCASGKDASYPVTVKATSAKKCKGGSVYNRLTLTFTARKPKASNRLTSWTLGCPT